MNYKRILLKLSGEALSDGGDAIYNKKVLENIYEEVKFLVDKKVQVSIVIGGGNIWRGEIANQINLDHEKADYMGMLATSINSIALTSFFNNKGLESVFVNMFEIENVAKNATPEVLNTYLNEGKVVIFGGGTGKPFFSTDTAASLRAKETNAEAIFIAKNNTNGIYDKDPNTNQDAIFYPEITFQEIIDRKLKVIDITAIELLKTTNIELIIFNMNRDNFIKNLYNNSNQTKTIVNKKKQN